MNRSSALLEMLQKYRTAFASVWRRRREFDPPPRLPDELAFLPAQLEWIHTPVSPLPRAIMRTIMVLFALAVVWACLGRMEIVAVAPGKTVTNSRTKWVQPSETAVVSRLLAHDGQQVKKGDLLIELDATSTSADAQKAADTVLSARLALAKSEALVHAVDLGAAPQVRDEAFPRDRLTSLERLVQGEYATYQAKVMGTQAALEEKQAELRTTESAIPSLAQYLDIASTRVKDYEALLDKNYVPRQEYLQRKQERIVAERDLETQRRRREELLSSIAGARQELAATRADARRQWLDESRQAQEQLNQYAPELTRANRRQSLMELRAPVDGSIQQLAVHTVGGVVTPAQQLLAVVPSDEPLEIEATVLNRDIGFIRRGQSAVIKVDSFPFTRYGYLHGQVESVSEDAMDNEKLGPVYTVRVSLAGHPKAPVKLGPGMSLSVEINTGERRLIDYVLEPLREAVASAGRER